jgi:hypothetical protein
LQSSLIAIPPHDDGSGNGDDEAADVKGRLHQSSLQARYLKCLPELADEDIVEIVRNAPKEKQARH